MHPKKVSRPRVATPAASPVRAGRSRTAWLLGVLAFAVYLSSWHQTISGDTVSARLLMFSLVREHNFDLEEFSWLRPDGKVPYFIQPGRDGRMISHYPVLTPLLAAPLALPAVWWQRALGIEDDDVRFRLATLVVERTAAALIAAVSVGLLYLAAATLTAPGLAAGVAAAYAFGTSTWSISSQAMWQHGLAELSLAGLSLALLGADTRRRAYAAGAWAALAVAARPIMLILALLALVYVWRDRRTQRFAFLLPAAAVAVLLLAYNLAYVGRPTGGYVGEHFALPNLAWLMGVLFSPSRGLLVYTPLAVLAVPVAWRAGRANAGWLAYLVLGIAGYLLMFGSFRFWWGGNCYGPRYLTDVLPAIALCAVPTVERWWSRRLGRAALAGLVVWSVAVQAIGAYCDDDGWNLLPKLVDRHPERLWDVVDSQIVRAVRGGWRGGDLAPLLGQMLTDRRPALLRPLTPEQLAGDIVAARPFPWRAPAGRGLDVELRVVNRGGAVWPVFTDWGDLPVKVLFRWWRDGAVIPDVGELLPLWRNLGPGEAAPVRARIEVPARPGLYEIEFMIVQKLGPVQGRFGGALLRGTVAVE